MAKKLKSKKSKTPMKKNSKSAKTAKAKTAKAKTAKSIKAKPAKKIAKAAQKPMKKEAAPNLRPIRDQILLWPDAMEEKTAGGLYIPATVSEKPYAATVVAAGKGVYSKKGKFRPTSVQAGDRVFFWKYGGQEVVLGGEKFIIIRESDLLGFAPEK